MDQTSDYIAIWKLQDGINSWIPDTQSKTQYLDRIKILAARPEGQEAVSRPWFIVHIQNVDSQRFPFLAALSGRM